MTKSELIQRLSIDMPHLKESNIKDGVDSTLELISESLSSVGRMDVRGFGAFSLKGSMLP